MQPHISLDESIIRENAIAWQAFARTAVRAVVKARGYGWGYAPLVRALDDVVSGYCVADADELRELRAFTQLPVAVLGSEPPRIAEIIALDGVPTIQSASELETARASARGAHLRVRVSVVRTAGWSGLSIAQVGALAPALARSRAAVESGRT